MTFLEFMNNNLEFPLFVLDKIVVVVAGFYARMSSSSWLNRPNVQEAPKSAGGLFTVTTATSQNERVGRVSYKKNH